VNLKTGLTNEWTNRVPRNVRRNIGMPMGDTDKDKSEFSLVSQVDVKRALAVWVLWILLHKITCIMIIAKNYRTLGWI
jgi:hypothetical protein